MSRTRWLDREPREAGVTAAFTPSERRLIEAAACEREWSVSSLIRRLVLNALADHSADRQDGGA